MTLLVGVNGHCVTIILIVLFSVISMVKDVPDCYGPFDTSVMN